MFNQIEMRKPDMEKEEVMRRLFLDRCVLFDMYFPDRTFLYRGPAAKSPEREDLMESLRPEEWQIMKEHLLRITETPLVCRAGGELCVLIPSLAGSTALALLLFPHMEEARFLRLAKRDESLFCFSPDCEPPVGCRVSARTRESLAEYEAFLREIKACFCGLEFDGVYGVERDISEWLRERVRALSHFCGCPVELTMIGNPMDGGDLDRSLLVSFLLMCLMLARNKSFKREATVILEACEDGCLMEIRFELNDEDKLMIPRLILMQIAAQKNIFFEESYRNSVYVLRLIPRRIDWSYLGLKQETI